MRSLKDSFLKNQLPTFLETLDVDSSRPWKDFDRNIGICRLLPSRHHIIRSCSKDLIEGFIYERFLSDFPRNVRCWLTIRVCFKDLGFSLPIFPETLGLVDFDHGRNAPESLAFVDFHHLRHHNMTSYPYRRIHFWRTPFPTFLLMGFHPSKPQHHGSLFRGSYQRILFPFLALPKTLVDWPPSAWEAVPKILSKDSFSFSRHINYSTLHALFSHLLLISKLPTPSAEKPHDYPDIITFSISPLHRLGVGTARNLDHDSTDQ